MYVHLPTVATALGTLLRRPGRFGRRLLLNGAFAAGVHFPLTGALAAMRGLDHVFWRQFRQQNVTSPVFVVSNPRSGTTYLHRLMCLDEERFTYLKLWQTIFPSVAFYRAVRAVGAVDRRVGAPLAKLVAWSEKRFFGGWEGVHNMGFSAAEEEEAYFVHTWVTPAMMMFYPFVDELEGLSILDDMPEDVRRKVMGFHRESVQRHLHATGDNRSFLSKNVICSGRIHSLLDVYPDARIVQIVRHPYEALPSFCSMFSIPWKVHSPEIAKDSHEARYWARLGVRFYLHTHRALQSLPKGRVASVRYDQLIEDPVQTVLSVYEQLGLEVSDAFRARLEKEGARRGRSYERKHSYSLEEFGLTPEWIQEELREVFDYWGFETELAQDAAQ